MSHDPGPHSDRADLSRERARFAAELSRRLSDIESALVPLKFDGANPKAHHEVRRRVHSLRSSAGALGFLGLARRVALAEDVLDRAERPGLGPGEHTELLTLLRGLPELALEDARATAADTPTAWSLLVIGGDEIAELAARAAGGGVDIERCMDAGEALALARVVAPDACVIDADTPGARELCAALARDPMTSSIRRLVVGTFASPEAAAGYLASGAARVLAKPLTPDTLRSVLAGPIAAMTTSPAERLGDLSLFELSSRLSEELHRALVEGADVEARTVRVAYGDGHELLSSLWTSLARIRDAITARSQGAVRFDEGGPAGALWLSTFDDDPRTARPRAAAETSLEGRTVLVVDDDPAVTWFFAGVFKAAGCKVLEAWDGEQALGMLWRAPVDLVVSDVVMPRADGVAVSFAMKRDVLLHDVPVLLVSWREDLLLRVRELGAKADGWLLKDASAGVVLARAREVLQARSAVEGRLRTLTETRGRLDGLSTSTLLRLAASLVGDARVVVRDGVFQFEVDLRGGALARATQIGAETTLHGREALTAMLGVTSGRFVVTREDHELDPNLPRMLEEELARAAAGARAAQRLLSAAQLFSVGRVELHQPIFDAYQAAAPESLRAIGRKLAEGVSPRELALRGGIPVSVLEAILGSAARRGAVSRVLDAYGEDLLACRTEREASLAASARGESPLPHLDAGSLPALTPSPLAGVPGLSALRPAVTALAPLAPSEPDGPADLLTPLELPARPGHVDFDRLVEDASPMFPPDLEPLRGITAEDELRDLPLAALVADEGDDDQSTRSCGGEAPTSTARVATDGAIEEPVLPLTTARRGGAASPDELRGDPKRSRGGTSAKTRCSVPRATPREVFDLDVAPSHGRSPVPEPVQLDVDAAPPPARAGWRRLGIFSLFGGALLLGASVFVSRGPIEAGFASSAALGGPAVAAGTTAAIVQDLPLREGETTLHDEGILEIFGMEQGDWTVDGHAMEAGDIRIRASVGDHELRRSGDREGQPIIARVVQGRVARVDLKASSRR